MINELQACALNSHDCHVNVMVLTPRITIQFVYFKYTSNIAEKYIDANVKEVHISSLLCQYRECTIL